LLTEPHAMTPAFVQFQVERKISFSYTQLCMKKSLIDTGVCVNTVTAANIKNKLRRPEKPILAVTAAVTFIFILATDGTNGWSSQNLSPVEHE